MSDRCKTIVPSPGSFRGFPCSRKATRDGYCTQHHPESEKARRAASDAKWKAEWDAKVIRKACLAGFHDFWCQVSIAALLIVAHHHTESEHNAWPELDTWWAFFCRGEIY